MAAERLAAYGERWRGRAQLAVISRPNPDGYTLRQRANSRGIDLNRDHLLLRAGETRVIHQFLRQWTPEVVIDVHNYPSRRKLLLKRNLVRAADVCIDIPTHPALWTEWSGAARDELVRRIGRRIEPGGGFCDRYAVLTANGGARSSTFRVADARNGLTLRLGAFGVLIEGRAPVRSDSRGVRERLLVSLTEALLLSIEWAADNIEAICRWRSVIRSRPAPVGWKSADTGTICLHLFDEAAGEPREVAFLACREQSEVRVSVPAPAAYAIPCSMQSVLELLDRHGLPGHAPAEGRVAAETARITALRGSRVVSAELRNTLLDLSGYRIIRVTRVTSAFLAVLLEPQSRYALHRVADFGIHLCQGEDYPIVRLPEVKTPPCGAGCLP
ncbi:MAG: hypothetical protein SFV51_21140 [Bryobacteraceae bacterium]|nr:hypothetical protein [Bryobacteraceae bacterium]